MEKRKDLAIIGSGPAGLTAAIYAARAGLDCVVLDGMLSGGRLVQTIAVENYPGFAEPVSGMDLMAAMRAQAERAGASFEMDEVQSVDFGGTDKVLHCTIGDVAAKAVIVATGASVKWTGLPGEKEYRNKGVSVCATCDGSFFRGAEVAVIGGGDTALGDALYLAGVARKVTIVHRRSEFRGTKLLQDRVRAASNISLALDTTVSSFNGDGSKLRSLTIVRRLPDGSSEESSLRVDGAFVAIGHEPQTAFLAGSLELDAAGYVKTGPGGTNTSEPGVFAAGDCADPRYRQAVVAAGAGAAAAMDAISWLREKST